MRKTGVLSHPHTQTHKKNTNQKGKEGHTVEIVEVVQGKMTEGHWSPEPQTRD